MPARARAITAPLFFVLFSLCCFSAKAQTLTVTALADDAHAAVLSDEGGKLQRYAVGDSLTGLAWKLVAVTADDALFERAPALHGSPVRIHVGLGKSIDFAAIDLRLTHDAQPTLRPMPPQVVHDRGKRRDPR